MDTDVAGPVKSGSAVCASMKTRLPFLGASLPPPTLGERRHRGLARRLITVRRGGDRAAAEVSAMHNERLEVSVTFDERRGYVASAPGLPPVTALSLGGLRRRIESMLMPDEVEVMLHLDQ